MAHINPCCGMTVWDIWWTNGENRPWCHDVLVTSLNIERAWGSEKSLALLANLDDSMIWHPRQTSQACNSIRPLPDESIKFKKCPASACAPMIQTYGTLRRFGTKGWNSHRYLCELQSKILRFSFLHKSSQIIPNQWKCGWIVANQPTK